MPQTLSEKPEELVRQFIVDNARSSEMQGYDPQQTNSQATDFLMVTSSASKWGTTFPMVFVGEQNGPAIPNAGETNANGVQGNGSGQNQYAIHSITLSVQTTETADGAGYLNSTDFDVLAKQIYDECRLQIQQNPHALSGPLYMGVPTPPTPTRDPGENDSSTLDWYQLQGQIPLGVQYIP